jgi:hypothetical protein
MTKKIWHFRILEKAEVNHQLVITNNATAQNCSTNNNFDQTTTEMKVATRSIC